MTKAGHRRVVFRLGILALALSVLLSVGLVPTRDAETQVSSLPLQFLDVVLLATNSIRVGNNAQVLAGHVVVNTASPGPTLSPGFELALGANARTPAGYAIVGDSIQVAANASVGGNAFYNSLSNAGTIKGALHTPLPAFPIFAPLPAFRAATPGTQDVTVGVNQAQTLAPGNYRDVTVRTNATLRLSAGVYSMRSLVADSNAKVLFQNLASGNADVRIQGQLTTGSNAIVRPDDGDPLKAAKVVFYVGFISGTALTPNAVTIGNNGTFQANLYAPNGTVRLDNNVNATGAFLARDIDVANGASVDLETFFSQQQSPSITSPNATTFTIGQLGTFTVTTTGVPTPSITRGGVALPSGVTFVDNGNGTGTLRATPAAGTAGTYAITFTAGNGVSPNAVQTFTLTVVKASQTLQFTSTPPAGPTVGGPIYTVTATATSGLPVTLTIDASAAAVCSISGATVSFIGAGTCVIDANQPGNASYNPAPQIQQSFAVGKRSQTITFTSTAPSNATVGGSTYTVTATATSGLPVSFTIDASATSVCSISGATVSFIGAGTCVIDANQPGDAGYSPAPQVQQSFAVGKRSQTITFTSTAPSNAIIGGPTYTVTATATSGLPVSFTIDASATSVCSISGATVSFIGAGTCVIDANQPGNASYNPAPQVQQFFVIGSGLPPNPSTVAPALRRTETTDLGSATSFLYTGPNPIQTSVSPGTIDLKRAAVIVGRVLDRGQAPISGVTVRVLNRPEFGQTNTRVDGQFDLAVNGGAPFTISFEKAGLLPVQRLVTVPWQSFAPAPDVIMIPVDAEFTVVDLGSAGLKVARGRVVTDTDGTRQSTLLLPQGITASLQLPGGGSTPISRLTLRQTEYTDGPTGPQTMPAVLPGTSGYTYAVELSADEAIAAGATGVVFSQALYHYLDNFLAFPVGEHVPVGYYDRQRGIWVSSPDGRVIKILSVTSGLADIDADGDNVADNATQLAALGFTSAERQALAGLYAVGKTLWRVPITHFTTYDMNYAYVPDPPDPPLPPTDPPQNLILYDKADKLDDCPICNGSRIESTNQILGEAIGLVGTEFSLHYASDRSRGVREIEIPLSAGSTASTLKRIELEVEIAGKVERRVYHPPIAPHATDTFTWDGTDRYGRVVFGAQPLRTKLTHVYPVKYTATARDQELNFARTSESGIAIGGSRAASEAVLVAAHQGSMRSPYVAPAIGGWSLSVHHAYDPADQVLYLGTGRRRTEADSLGRVIDRFAGTGVSGHLSDNAVARQAPLADVIATTVGPDGSVYILSGVSGNAGRTVSRVDRNGTMTIVAGPGPLTADGVPATQAALDQPQDIAIGPDGLLYIAEFWRVRRVGADGIIRTIAGAQCCVGKTGDGGPALLATFGFIKNITIGPDGRIYVLDIEGSPNTIRVITPDGRVFTYAGNGPGLPSFGADCSFDLANYGVCGTNIPAAMSRFFQMNGLAASPDGSLWTGSGRWLIRIDPSGMLRKVGAGPFETRTRDDGAAIGSFDVNSNVGLGRLATGFDGSLLFVRDGPCFGCVHVFRAAPDGHVYIVSGGAQLGSGGPREGGPAKGPGWFWVPENPSIGPDGRIYVSDLYRVRVVSSRMPSFVGLTDHVIASEDGRELYRFNGNGRHLDTRHALTGAVLYSFAYDAAGRLIGVTDGDGNVTTIERTGAGVPTGILGPFGQRTVLTVDAHDRLATVTNPAAEQVRLGYTPDGLLNSVTTPRNHTFTYQFDALGRLFRQDDPAGGSQTFSRVDLVPDANLRDGHEVTRATGLGRTSRFKVEYLRSTERRETTTDPDGTVTTELVDKTTARSITAPTGATMTALSAGDPRFGMQSQVLHGATTRMPSGLTLTTSQARTATLSDPLDLLSLTQLTETGTINGRTTTSVYDAATRTFVATSALGRTSTTTVDALGRPLANQVSGLAPIAYQYDARGRLTRLTAGTGPEVRTTTFTYTPEGYVETVTDPLGRVTRFTYDAAGRPLAQTLPDLRLVAFTYDASGNLASLVPPGRPAHVFSYSAVDLETIYDPPDVEPAEDRIQNTYNADRQLELLTRADGLTLDPTYDAAGRLSTLAFSRGAFGMSYHAASGLPMGVTAPDGVGLAYTYDGSLLTTTTWSGPVPGTVSRTYDADFRIATQSVNGTGDAVFTYDGDSLLTGAGALTITRDPQRRGLVTGTALGDVTDARAYNSHAEPTSYAARFGAFDLYSVQYIRDGLGRITRKIETIQGVADSYDYTYDTAGRLTGVLRNGTANAAYTYDSNDNRRTYTGPLGNVPSATYDAQDRMTSYGGQAYTYTAHGDLRTRTTGAGTTTYRYDELGNLAQVVLPDGTRVDYVIDGENRRIGKKVNGSLTQRLLWDGALRIVAELDGVGLPVSRFVYATRVNVPDYVVQSGVTYRLVTDHLGSLRLVVNAETGDVVQRMNHDEFGRVTLDHVAPGFTRVPFGFAGGLYDPHTTLLRFAARDYDPESGRWTSKDPIRLRGGQTNFYVRTGQDPINLTDAAGAAPQTPQDWMEVVSALVDYVTKPNCPCKGSPHRAWLMRTIQAMQSRWQAWGGGGAGTSRIGPFRGPGGGGMKIYVRLDPLLAIALMDFLEDRVAEFALPPDKQCEFFLRKQYEKDKAFQNFLGPIYRGPRWDTYEEWLKDNYS